MSCCKGRQLAEVHGTQSLAFMTLWCSASTSVCAYRETHTLAVACNDIGRFVEYHPHGRYIVSDLRGKELVMRLMQHPDGEVQKRALLAVQKIMLPVRYYRQVQLESAHHTISAACQVAYMAVTCPCYAQIICYRQ